MRRGGGDGKEEDKEEGGGGVEGEAVGIWMMRRLGRGRTVVVGPVGGKEEDNNKGAIPFSFRGSRFCGDCGQIH